MAPTSADALILAPGFFMLSVGFFLLNLVLYVLIDAACREVLADTERSVVGDFFHVVRVCVKFRPRHGTGNPIAVSLTSVRQHG